VTIVDKPELWRQLEDHYQRAPLVAALGLRLTVLAAGKVMVTFGGSRIALNRRDRISGGALATMLDSSIMQACKTLLRDDELAITMDLKVNYLSEAQATPLTTIAEVEHRGRSSCVGLARITCPDGRKVAVGTSIVAIRPK
jgi:uncharacterized protein (TIGR00369 family)